VQYATALDIQLEAGRPGSRESQARRPGLEAVVSLRFREPFLEPARRWLPSASFPWSCSTGSSIDNTEDIGLQDGDRLDLNQIVGVRQRADLVV